MSRHQLTAVVLLLAFGLLGSGYLNASRPRIRFLRMSIAKPVPGLEKTRLVMVSDIHLGTVIRNSRLLKIVERINSQRPDLVLLVGDVVDEDVSTVAEQNMVRSFRKLHPPFGVFAVTGNHEYFSGVKEAVQYLEESGITVLQDEAVKVAAGIYLVGRKDLMENRMGAGRKPLKEILQGVDPQFPVILLDHQPFHLQEAMENKVDLQLSGHTHHGQIFPFNFITRQVYEKSWGYLRKGNTQYYVSCGVGTWGPPVRLGNRPEIVVIDLFFRKPEDFKGQ